MSYAPTIYGGRYMTAGRRRRRVHGRGVLSFLKNIGSKLIDTGIGAAGKVGENVGTKYLERKLGLSGKGRRRTHRRRRVHGRGPISTIASLFGLGRRRHRRVHRRVGGARRRTRYGGYRMGYRRCVHRGRGFLDVLKGIGNKVLDVGTGLAGKWIGSKLGLGRRRRHHRTMGGRLLGSSWNRTTGGRRRYHKRRMHGRGPISAIASLFGLGRRRRYHRRVGGARRHRRVRMML